MEREVQASQQANRKEQMRKPRAVGTSPYDFKRNELLQQLDVLTVIRLLVEMIQEPGAKAASLSQRLQRQGESITAEQVRGVIEFYSLSKKTES
jgi:hypothetical protein